MLLRCSSCHRSLRASSVQYSRGSRVCSFVRCREQERIRARTSSGCFVGTCCPMGPPAESHSTTEGPHPRRSTAQRQSLACCSTVEAPRDRLTAAQEQHSLATQTLAEVEGQPEGGVGDGGETNTRAGDVDYVHGTVTQGQVGYAVAVV